MHTIQAILALAFISLALANHAPYHYDYCFRAYDKCDWQFRGYPGIIPSFSVRSMQDKSFTPRIVSKEKSEVIGILNTNNIVPEFIGLSGDIPITKFGSPNFTPTHFKPFNLPYRLPYRLPYHLPYLMGSGVGHQTFHGNQQQVAKGRCVRLYFTNYQKLVGEHPTQVDNVNVGREDNKCVVFRLH